MLPVPVASHYPRRSPAGGGRFGRERRRGLWAAKHRHGITTLCTVQGPVHAGGAKRDTSAGPGATSPSVRPTIRDGRHTDRMPSRPAPPASPTGRYNTHRHLHKHRRMKRTNSRASLADSVRDAPTRCAPVLHLYRRSSVAVSPPADAARLAARRRGPISSPGPSPRLGRSGRDERRRQDRLQAALPAPDIALFRPEVIDCRRRRRNSDW